MHGYIRICSASPKLIVSNCIYNAKEIISIIKQSVYKSIKVIVFPELCITGYTCGDLFFQSSLLNSAEKALLSILTDTKYLDILIAVGMPVKIYNQLFNCAIIIHKGNIKGIVPKSYLPNNNEFMEKRWFSPAKNLTITEILFCGQVIPIGVDLLFSFNNIKDLIIGVEICQDVWNPISPSSHQALNGANLILNLSASNELNNKYESRKNLIISHSSKIKAAYVYSSCNFYESSADIVFSGHNMICENGKLIEESNLFEKDSKFIFNDIDIETLEKKRMINNNSFYESKETVKIFRFVYIDLLNEPFNLKRFISKYPFLPERKNNYKNYYENIFNIQSIGLAKRIMHIGSKNSIIAVSGGLDSTLALLCIIKAYDFLKIDKKHIIGITMPGFGTTDRTYNNAINLIKSLGITLKVIDIKNSCLKHFEDIDHNFDNYDITFENAQARERTQILMDIANMNDGLVVGTGNLSELALGFTTYNGDHMSMYNVNVSVPKTLVKELLIWILESDKFNSDFKNILKDILNTPISPELMPLKENGELLQLTEEIVGSYVLNDFYLYYVVGFGFSPEKIIFLAQCAFKDLYTKDELISRLEYFYERFFSNQFKRSCMPDGPKVGEISLSCRADWKVSSDISYKIWMDEVKKLKNKSY